MRVRRGPIRFVRGPLFGPEIITTPLPLSSPFQACLPFNLAIAATPAPPARLELTAEPAVLEAITASVAGTTLSLAASSFATGAPITAVLRVPADAVANITASSPGGAAVLASGLAPAGGALTLTAYGGAELQARATTAATVNASAGGASLVVVEGAFDDASVVAGGAARVFVAGAAATVDVAASGAARVALAPASPNVTITGTVGGAAGVLTTKGACSLEAGGWGGFAPPPRCGRGAVTLPPNATRLWTCGVALVGNASCNSDGGFASFASGGSTAAGGPFFGGGGSVGTFAGVPGACAGAGPGGAMAGPGGAFASAGGRRLRDKAAAFSSASSNGGGGGGSSYMSSTTTNGKTTVVTGGGGPGGVGVVSRSGGGADGTTVYTTDGGDGVASSPSNGATVVNSGGRVTYIVSNGAPAPSVVTAPRCAAADKDRRMKV